MTPRRRDRFFQSLHQLEQRLASESSHIKKPRLAGDSGFANAEAGANTNPISKCGSPDPHTTSDDGAAHANDCRFTGVNATSQCCLADVTASTCGLTCANARFSCGLTNVNLASPYTLIENVLPASAHPGIELADIDPTSMNAGRIGPGVPHVRLRLADAYPLATCGLPKTLHFESSVAHVGSAGAESINDYRGLAKTSHAGAYVESAAVGLAEGYPTQIGTLAKAKRVGPASKHVAWSDVDHTTMEVLAEIANVGTALTHVGTAVVQLEVDSPAAMDKVAGTELLGPPIAKLGSTVSELGDVYPTMIGKASGRAHVGPALAQVQSLDFGLTDANCKPTHELAGRAHIDYALAHAGVGLEDVRLSLTERLTEMAHAGPALAPVGSVLVGPPVRMPMVESTAHIEPALALYGSKSTEITGLKGAVIGSESSDDKDGSANARVTTDITIRRGIMNDEYLMNVVDNLLVNVQKTAIVCATDSRETRGICENGAAGRTQCTNGPLPITIEDNMVRETAKIVARQVVGDALHEIQGKDGGTEYGTVNECDAVTSGGDGKQCVTLDDFAHMRESLESATLCEDEEQMYDAIFSSDGEDSGSLLVLSACWNPWETSRHADVSDSNPPVEFLSTPMINNTLGTIDRNTPEFSSNWVCRDLQEQKGNGSPDLTRLCVLLGLDEQGLRMEAKKPSLSLQVNELLSSDQGSLDFGALNHELPGSTFYSNVAKVGENHFQYAEALDFWLQRLSQAQSEPYCRALLLIAKASLQEDKGSPIGSLGKFPSIIQEWLAVHHVADQQERIQY